MVRDRILVCGVSSFGHNEKDISAQRLENEIWHVWMPLQFRLFFRPRANKLGFLETLSDTGWEKTGFRMTLQLHNYKIQSAKNIKIKPSYTNNCIVMFVKFLDSLLMSCYTNIKSRTVFNGNNCACPISI